MWTLEEKICLVILVLMAIIDMRKRQIPENMLAVCGIIVLVYHLINHTKNAGVLLGGVGCGILFLLVSRFTEEALGYGDSWVILILGGYCGIWKLLEILAGAFFMAGLCSIVVLGSRKIRGKRAKQYRLPFIPFLMAGYAVVLLEEGGIL